VQYRVNLAGRALRDVETIYDAVEADTSLQAFAWFNGLVQAIYSLERFPDRGTAVSGSKRFRQLLFGKRPSVYRIIYAIDKRNRVVNVLHIRHAARAVRSAE
jgi:plasmid stabilization system protein ParE